MSRNKILILTLVLLFSLTMCPQVECGQNGKEEAGVTIELTKLDVNDTTLELSYKIRNNTDHDVWVCSSSPQYPSVYEYFLDKDGKTLVLRRQSELPMREELTMKYPPLKSRYVRLPPGQEKAESISLTVPIRPYRISEGESGNAEYAGRLALEIGFYDEDLPGLILQIVELAEKLNCDLDVGLQDFREIRERFFGGRMIAQAFKHLLGFSESVTSAASGGDELNIHYMGPVLNGEKVLRLEVNGVHIPYGSAPISEEPANDEVEDTPITLALTKLDVNDTNFDLGWKITNNTDHDIWVCEGVNVRPGIRDFEVYMSKDDQTLIIRRRFDLPITGILERSLTGRYVRLRPGQDQTESLSLTVPVRQSGLFEREQGNAEYAERLALETGFYDEDLQGTVLHIVEVAEKLSCDTNVLGINDIEIYYRYFGGLEIEGSFNSDAHFRESTEEGGEEILIPHIIGQLIKAEQISRMTVDGVSIPYKGYWPPLTGHGGKTNGDEQSNQNSSLNR